MISSSSGSGGSDRNRSVEPHQRGVDAAARHAGERADDRADHDRHHHRRQPDRQRDTAAVEHAGEQVLAEIVGAERMAQDGPCELGGEIDVVDRHAPRPAARTPPPRIMHEQDHRARPPPAGDGESAAMPRVQGETCRAATPRASDAAAASTVGDAGVEPAIQQIRDQVEQDRRGRRRRRSPP